MNMMVNSFPGPKEAEMEVRAILENLEAQNIAIVEIHSILEKCKTVTYLLQRTRQLRDLLVSPQNISQPTELAEKNLKTFTD